MCFVVRTSIHSTEVEFDVEWISRVKRGVAVQHPQKYNLDEKELERVSALARIELEDARIELERAQEAAKDMGRGAEGEEADDHDEDEDAWVE
jgi:periodic tryptophan protein 1